MALSTLPRSGWLLLLVNAILQTCSFALLLAAFVHTDWSHTQFQYEPRAGLTYQTYIGPWRQCRVDGQDTSAPINPSSGSCMDPILVDGKLQAFRSFLVIGLFFSFITMILAWIRFARYAADKLVSRGFDLTLIGCYIMTAISLAIVCGIAPYILDDIKAYVENETALIPAVLGGPASATYGNSFKIFLAAFALSVVLMFSQIIGYVSVLRHVDTQASYPTHAKTEMQPTNQYPQNVGVSTTTIDSRV